MCLTGYLFQRSSYKNVDRFIALKEWIKVYVFKHKQIKNKVFHHLKINILANEIDRRKYVHL